MSTKELEDKLFVIDGSRYLSMQTRFSGWSGTHVVAGEEILTKKLANSLTDKKCFIITISNHVCNQGNTIYEYVFFKDIIITTFMHPGPGSEKRISSIYENNIPLKTLYCIKTCRDMDIPGFIANQKQDILFDNESRDKSEQLLRKDNDQLKKEISEYEALVKKLRGEPIMKPKPDEMLRLVRDNDLLKKENTEYQTLVKKLRDELQKVKTDVPTETRFTRRENNTLVKILRGELEDLKAKQLQDKKELDLARVKLENYKLFEKKFNEIVDENNELRRQLNLR
jgi:hypothetical protein